MGRIKRVRCILTSVMFERIDRYFCSTAWETLVFDNEIILPKPGLPSLQIFETFDQDVKVN